jgi:hypothetical protein
MKINSTTKITLTTSDLAKIVKKHFSSRYDVKTVDFKLGLDYGDGNYNPDPVIESVIVTVDVKDSEEGI